MVGLITGAASGSANMDSVFRPLGAQGNVDQKPAAAKTDTYESTDPQARKAKGEDAHAPKGANGKPLTRDQQLQVSELKARDRAVRAHEAAHKAVGGSLAGGISLSYEVGPDGQSYAVGGEVSIEIGSERDPSATISKMERVVAAALAPADPSSQDQAVAAQAGQTMAEARRQLTEQQQAKQDQAKTESGKKSDKPGPIASEPVKMPAVGPTARNVANAYAAPAAKSGKQLNLIA